MRALLVTTDLLIASHVEGAAKRQVAELEVVHGTQIGQLATFDAVFVDLGAISGELIAELQRLREGCPATTTLVAFGPHVHRAKLDAARAAGFEIVLSRGEFHARVDELLSI
jgi:hypothetical protein